MNIFKKRKFILPILIFIAMTTLSFGVLQLFQFKNVQKESVYAFTSDGVDVDFTSMATVTMEDGWSKSSDGVYVSSISSGLTSKSKSLTVGLTLTEKSKVSINIVVSSGTFSVSPSSVASSGGTILILEAGSHTFKFTSKSAGLWGAKGSAKVEFISVEPYVEGIKGTSIKEGYGTPDSPFIISEQDDFAVINKNLSANYKLVNNISLTGNFTPIGSGSAPFGGTFDGGGFEISNMTISGGTYRGMFASTSAGTIKNLTLTNVNITNASTYSGMLIGYAVGGTVVQNVDVSGNLSAVADCIGGIVGYANGHAAVKASGCDVEGTVLTTSTRIGGLSGAGGTFSDCVVYADVLGAQLVGGLTGGYKQDIASGDKVSGIDFGSYTNCFVQGNVYLIGEHAGNYPYWGLINGYGAYCKYTLSNVGQNISVNYTSSKTISEVRIFGNDSTPSGIVVEEAANTTSGSFKEPVTLSQTYAGGALGGMDLLSDTKVVGITGNYGGFTIRFKMEDGTYKYVSTMNKNATFTDATGVEKYYTCFQSKFDINLDDLTSYVDNFANINIDTSKGTKSFTNGDIDVWGTAPISNANDLEHLAWVINGAIPTTFANAYYNSRSGITISVQLQNDIDLTVERKDANGNVLNRNSRGEIINEFRGFGLVEMYPYRGNFYGNNKTLTVNMNMPGAYILGIICCSTEQEAGIKIENLTLNGTIVGRQRVGIVGMHDNFARNSSVTYTNVINNANITAESQVGAFIGEAQGNGTVVMGMGTQETAKIILNNCVNNGNITATVGDAGGFAGMLDQRKDKYTVITINNCANNGIVSAYRYAGGFVGVIDQTVTIQGTNISSGIVTSQTGTANFYVGLNRTAGFSTTEGLKTIYKINLGTANVSANVTATGATLDAAEYITDANGILNVGLLNTPTFAGVTLSLKMPFFKNAITITPTASNTDTRRTDVQYQKTMATFVKVPVAIVTLESNVYNTTISTQNWVLQASVSFGDGTTEIIDLKHNISTEQLASKRLVFSNVVFDHATYNIPESFTRSLYRITAEVEDYVNKAALLVAKTNGTNAEFATLGTNAKAAYDVLFTEFSKDGYALDMDRFKGYIINTTTNVANTDVSYDVMLPYYQNIVINNGIDDSQLNNVSVAYGTYTVTKQVVFTMLTGENKTETVTYSFTKSDIDNSFNVVASTGDIKYSVGDVETFIYKKDYNIKVNIHTISSADIIFQDAEYVYDTTNKSVALNLNIIEGDNVGYVLQYTNVESGAVSASVANAGTYEVSIKELNGADAKFYQIPATYTKGEITISPITFKLEAPYAQEFVYSAQQQKPQFELVQQNESDYVVQDTDWTITYVGSKGYNSISEPTNVDTYTVTASFINNNFAIEGSNNFTFAITQKAITDITFENEFIYCKDIPTFNFEVKGVIPDTSVGVKKFQINGESGGVNADDYTVTITDLDNSNYCIPNGSITKDFVVNPAPVTVSFSKNLSSIYGDDMEDLTTDLVIEGTVYFGDELQYTIDSIPKTFGEYPFSAVDEDDNYEITFNEGLYKVTKRPITILYGQKEKDYEADDIYDEIINPTISNIVPNDRNHFIFTLTKEIEGVACVVDSFRNAGTYVLTLNENDVFKNYSGIEYSFEYKINPIKMVLEIDAKKVSYNEKIDYSISDSYKDYLAGFDKLEEIATLNYFLEHKPEMEISTFAMAGVFTASDESSINIEKPDAGKYSINLNLGEEDYFNNYIIDIVPNELEVTPRETEVRTNEFVDDKIYNEQEIEFIAKIFGKTDDELVEENPTVTITRVRDELSFTETEIVKVGEYTIVVEYEGDKNNFGCRKTFEGINIYPNNVEIEIKETNIVYNANDYVLERSYSMTEFVNIDSKLTSEYTQGIQKLTSIQNAGTYTLTFSIPTDDNYVIVNPTHTIVIDPIKYKLTTQSGKEFDYDKLSHAPEITKERLNESSYVLQDSDLSVQYLGLRGYNDVELPSDADNYTVKLKFTKGNNIQFVLDDEALSTEDSFTFVINPKAITDITFENNFVYCKAKPKFNFTVHGIYPDDTVGVKTYKVNGESEGVNAKNDYTVTISALDNANYCIPAGSITKPFEVEQAPITISFNKKLESIYGDEMIDLYENAIISGTVYPGDELQYSWNKIPMIAREEPYDCVLVDNDSNYEIKCDKEYKYTVLKRSLTINYSNAVRIYTAVDAYNTIVDPDISGIAEGDENKFTFTLTQEKDGVDFVVDSFRNVGKYTLTLNPHDDHLNYEINATDFDYEITAVTTSIKVTDILSRHYTKPISSKDLQVKATNMVGGEDVIDLFDYTFKITKGNEEYEVGQLDVGEYTIELVVGDKNESYYNYSIEKIEYGKLEIIKDNTFINVSHIQKWSKIYDEIPFDLKAEMHTADGKIEGAKITYEIKLNGEPVDEINKVGTYKIIVYGDAGDNYDKAQNAEPYTFVVDYNHVTIKVENSGKVFDGENYIPQETINTTAEVNILDKLKREYKQGDQTYTAIKNQGSYVLTYSIPNDNYVINFEPLKITISPIKYKLTTQSGKEFDYDKLSHAPEITMEKLNESSYELQDSDLSVQYVGLRGYNDEELPIDADSYTVKVTFANDNIKFVVDNERLSNLSSFTFIINPKAITDITFENNFVYCKAKPKFNFTVHGIYPDDTVGVKTYKVNGESEGVNAKNDYTVTISALDNANYCIPAGSITKPFEVEQAPITISFNKKLESIYGDEMIDLYENAIISGTVYPGDELQYSWNKIPMIAREEPYDCVLVDNDSNYEIKCDKEYKYTVLKRQISINYGEKVRDYIGRNYTDIDLNNMNITNIVEKDKVNFIFTLTKEGTNVSWLRDAGLYEINLAYNAVFENYTGIVSTFSYIINPAKLTLEFDSQTVEYNQSFTIPVKRGNAVGVDNFDEIVSYQVVIKENGKIVTKDKPDHGTYDIDLVLTPKILFGNYNIEVSQNKKLCVDKRTTKVEATTLKSLYYYNEKPVDFNATIKGVLDGEIVENNPTITIVRNENIFENEIKNVGRYKITVNYDGDDNNKLITSEFECEIKQNSIKINLKTSRDYNGKEFEPEFTVQMSEMVEDIKEKLNKTYYQGDNKFTSITNAGDYKLVFSIDDENYAIEQSEFVVKINQAQVSVEIGNLYSVYGDTFNLEDCKITYSGYVEGEQPNLKLYVENFEKVVKEKGYVINATNLDGNYNIVNITTGRLFITKRVLTVSSDGETQITYNKEENYPTLIKFMVENALSEDAYLIEYINQETQLAGEVTNAGDYVLRITLKDKNNYQFAENSVLSHNITINKKIMSLTFDVESKTYDSQPVVVDEVSSGEVLDNAFYSVEFYRNAQRVSDAEIVGDYMVKIVPTYDKNYEFTNNEKTFKIDHRVVTIKFATKYEYNRNSQKPMPTLVNVADGDNVELRVQHVSATGQFVEVGDYSIIIEGLKGSEHSNYILDADNTVAYCIYQAEADVVIGDNSFTFNNEQIKEDDLQISFVANLAILRSDYELSVLPTNADVYTVEFISKNSNIKFNIDSFTLTVEKAEFGDEITLEDLTVVYNTEEHSLAVNKTVLNNKSVVEVEYVNNGHIDVKVEYINDAYEVSRYEVKAILRNPNYHEKELIAYLTINPLEETFALSSVKEFTYNRTEQGLEILGLDDYKYKHLIDFKYVGEHYSSKTKPTEAGNYQLQIFAENENNINIKNKINDFVICRREISLQNVDPQTVVYNGEQRKYIPEFTGLVAGDDVQIAIMYNKGTNLPVHAETYDVELYG